MKYLCRLPRIFKIKKYTNAVEVYLFTGAFTFWGVQKGQAAKQECLFNWQCNCCLQAPEPDILPNHHKLPLISVDFIRHFWNYSNKCYSVLPPFPLTLFLSLSLNEPKHNHIKNEILFMMIAAFNEIEDLITEKMKREKGTRNSHWTLFVVVLMGLLSRTLIYI